MIILFPILNKKAYSPFVTKSSCYKPRNVIHTIDRNRRRFCGSYTDYTGILQRQ